MPALRRCALPTALGEKPRTEKKKNWSTTNLASPPSKIFLAFPLQNENRWNHQQLRTGDMLAPVPCARLVTTSPDYPLPKVRTKQLI